MKLHLSDWFTVFAAALLIVAGLSGCKDSDTDSASGAPDDHSAAIAERQAAQQRAHDRAALATMLTMLTGQEIADTTDIDTDSRTFEPTYGSASDESNPLERSLLVDDAAMAETYFRSLAGTGSHLISETADGCTIDMTSLSSRRDGTRQNVGSLTFHRATEGSDCVAWADVDISCIPHLRRIAYKDSTQWGKNAFWTSPARRGDVFHNDGRYFICVRESHGYNWPSEHGVLLCIEPGKGSDYSTIYSDEFTWGAWRPKSQVLPGALEGAIFDYLRLSAGEGNFARTKQKILKTYFGQQVFPTGERFNWDGVHESFINTERSYAGEGFDTSEKDYSHHAGLWAYRDSENSDSDHDRSQWGAGGSVYAIIVRDATEGDWSGVGAGWARRLHHVALPYRCKGSVRAFSDTFSYYTGDSDGAFWGPVYDYFERFLTGKIVYTCRGVSFTDKIPAGFELMNI